MLMYFKFSEFTAASIVFLIVAVILYLFCTIFVYGLKCNLNTNSFYYYSLLDYLNIVPVFSFKVLITKIVSLHLFAVYIFDIDAIKNRICLKNRYCLKMDQCLQLIYVFTYIFFRLMYFSSNNDFRANDNSIYHKFKSSAERVSHFAFQKDYKAQSS